MKTKDTGALAFFAGFTLAAVPLSYWLLGLSYGDNSSKIAAAIAVEFATGFAARWLYLELLSKKNSN
jgi:hypothetical protein